MLDNIQVKIIKKINKKILLATKITAIAGVS